MCNILRLVVRSMCAFLVMSALLCVSGDLAHASQSASFSVQQPPAPSLISSRSDQLVAAADPAGSLAQSASAGTRDPNLQYVPIYMSWSPQSQFAGYIMAIEKDFFKNRGLDVELKWAALGQRPLESLAKSEVDFAIGWLSTGMALAAKEPRLVNFLQLHQRSASLLVTKSEVQTLSDLNGQTVLSWGGDFRIEFELFLKKNGIKPGRVLPLSASLAPFINKLVAATQAMEYNEIFRLLERGMREEELRVFRLDEYGVNMLGDGLYTREEVWRKNPALVRAVRDAVLEGWEYALAHEDETVKKVMEYAEGANQRTNSTHQRKMLQVMAQLITFQGWNDPQARGTLTEADFKRCKGLLLEYGEPVGALKYQTFFVRP